MLVGYSCYCLGTFLAGVVFRFRNINSFVVLTTYMTIMAVCGVNVPLDYYPTVIEWISRFVPLTNGLLSIRALLDGDPGSTILGYAALEGAVALGWMTAALLSFNQLLTRGRKDGSLDFGG
jgi:ABC-2 type transport system permease protein